MEDSLSSSYDSPRTRNLKSKTHLHRTGPDGDSTGQNKVMPLPNASTPAVNLSPQKSRRRVKKGNDLSANGSKSAVKRDSSMRVKRKAPRESITEAVGDSFGSMDSKRSRLSSAGSSLAESVGSKKKDKKTVAVTDLSWEMAVEKARGLPDGAMTSEDSMDDDEIDVDAPPIEAPQSKAEKEKSKPFSVMQCAGKILSSKKNEQTKDDSKKISNVEQTGATKNLKVGEKTKKELKIQRKMAKNQHYVLAQEAKSTWEQLRRTDIPPDKRKQLSADLYKQIRGKAKEMIFSHDTCRVIQCLLKYGSQEHKNAIFEEIKEHILLMSKSKYAKFFVRKLLKYGTKAQRDHVFQTLYGNVGKLIRHKEAAEIIECAYNDYANVTQRQALLQEFYGPSFSLFQTPGDTTLEQVFESNPLKKASILKNMNEILTALSEKSVLQYSIVHKVFLDYLQHSDEKLRGEMIENIREGVIHMLHTRDGARVAMMCLWYGTSKDRKMIIKSFKTFVAKICKEEFGHLVMLALFDVVDDTKLVNKAMIDELLKSVHELAQNPYGRKVLLYLLCRRDPLHFHPDVVGILQQGDNNVHSKKLTEIRQQELLDHVSRPLVQYLSQHCRELVTNNATLLLILSIITHVRSDPTEAMRAVSELAAEPFVAGSLGNVHIVEHTAGHMTLKKIILNDVQRMAKGESALFSGILLDILPEGSLKSWAACNRGCYILIALLDLNNPEVTRKVNKEILPIVDSLKRLEFMGAQNLLNKLR